MENLILAFLAEWISEIIFGIVGVGVTGVVGYIFPIGRLKRRLESVEQKLGEMNGTNQLNDSVQSRPAYSGRMPPSLAPNRFKSLPWPGIEPKLDPGIALAVKMLRSNGINTIESCEGGEGHSFTQPTVVFDGPYDESLRAVSIAMISGLPFSELRRTWRLRNGEFNGPVWEIVFSEKIREASGSDFEA